MSYLILMSKLKPALCIISRFSSDNSLMTEFKRKVLLNFSDNVTWSESSRDGHDKSVKHDVIVTKKQTQVSC